METLTLYKSFVVNLIFRRLKSTLLFIIILVGLYTVWNMTSNVASDEFDPMQDFDPRSWDYDIMERRIDGHFNFYVGDGPLKRIPDSWMDEKRCPACFGIDACVAIESGKLLVSIPDVETEANKKGVYFGKWANSTPVVIKRLSNAIPKEFVLFDEFICMNATGSKACDVSKAIVDSKSYAQVFTNDLAQLLHAWKICYPDEGPQALLYTQCMTSKMMKTFSDLYDNNKDGTLDSGERAMLFTSMVVQPESLMLKFMKGITVAFSRVAPKIYGACGRLIVVEHGGKLLENFIDHPWTIRCEIAMQLLSLVNLFWHPDQNWFILYKDFQYENIVVSHDREVNVIDYEQLSIVEEAESHGGDGHDGDTDKHNADEFDASKRCNEECFKELWKNLDDEKLSPGDRQKTCQSLHTVSGAYMYSMLCRNILSDLKEHREAADTGSKKYRGLLHSFPSDPSNTEKKELIMNALRECVSESMPGGRNRAVGELSTLLLSDVRHLD